MFAPVWISWVMTLKNLFKIAWVALHGKIGKERGAYDEHRTVILMMQKHAAKNTSWGKHSRAALTRMEVRDFPQKYVRSRLDVNDAGYLVIRVKNPNPVTLGDVRLRLTYNGPNNKRRVKYQALDRPLHQGQSLRIQMNIGPIVSPSEFDRFAVDTVNAAPLD